MGRVECNLDMGSFSKPGEGKTGPSEDHDDYALHFSTRHWIHSGLGSLPLNLSLQEQLRAAGGKETCFILRMGNCVPDEENSFLDSFKLILQV